MAHCGIATLWLSNQVDNPQVRIFQRTNCSLDDSARHGQNQEKEKNQLLISKLFFRQKILSEEKEKLFC